MKISEKEKIEKIIKILEEIALPGKTIVWNARECANKRGLRGLKEYLDRCRKSKKGIEIDESLEKQGKPSLRSEWPQIESIIENC